MAPSKTFEDIKRGNRSWWMPFLITAVVGYILFATIYSMIGMEQVMTNQMRLSASTSARIAQLPPEQRAMSEKISPTRSRAHFSPARCWCFWARLFLRRCCWGRSILCLAEEPSSGAFSRFRFTRACRESSKSLLGGGGDSRGDGAGVVQHREFCAYQSGAFLKRAERGRHSTGSRPLWM